MRIVISIVYLMFILLGISFAVLNASPVQVNFYITTLKLPISVLMTVMLGIGMLIGLLLFIGRYWRLKSEYRMLKNQLKLTEKEIKNLRAIPLKDQH